MKNNNLIITAVALIIVGALSFFGGMKYQQNQRGIGRGQFGGIGAGQSFQRFGGNSTRPISGQIISMDANSITVKLSDGSSKIIILSGSTSIVKTQTASKGDLKTGDTVAVFGTANSDGSFTAQSVQLNPLFRSAGSR